MATKSVHHVVLDDGGETTTLRIVHISDTHNALNTLIDDHRIPDGDVLIHSGDFSNSGTREEENQFTKAMGRLTHRHKILVAGNHEMPYEGEGPHVVQERFIPHGVVYLQDALAIVDGLRIYGTPWNNVHGHAFGRGETSRREIFEKIPRDEVDILVTHSPPLGIRDLTEVFDASAGSCRHCGGMHPGQEHWGDPTLLRVVEETSIPIHLFGHVHDAAGITQTDHTLYSNGALDALPQSATVIDVKFSRPRQTQLPSYPDKPPPGVVEPILVYIISNVATKAFLTAEGGPWGAMGGPVVAKHGTPGEAQMWVWDEPKLKPAVQREDFVLDLDDESQHGVVVYRWYGAETQSWRFTLVEGEKGRLVNTSEGTVLLQGEDGKLHLVSPESQGNIVLGADLWVMRPTMWTPPA